MASLIYDSGLDDAMRALIDFDADTFHVILLTSAYVPSKTAHTKRSDLSGEVVGVGYTLGGNAVTVGVTKDNANNRIDTSLGGSSWATSTITARYAAYVKWLGGAASADALVALIDFGADIISTNGTFNLTASTLRLQN